ncbi:hydrogenase formation protein HypD [Marinisporobacter balticus]|uniref:Hydrogenase expression/formation protein HypD n=1 Tax=Marinisporobacter balticus TaxID=2018667 RepID=A0A4R2KMG3_9FIRM|nr:hydrogenase formation protein HypD [Marinisporobacter balticus]TCO74624.1 hydrogenase expression/formation protein HypD [Marinisporobacter balticus]
MKYIKEFRDPKLAQKMLNDIWHNTKKDITIMEVCGTHTMSILKNGIRDLLPPNINLISGPGCPVCVTPQWYIDTAIALSERDNVIITTFGDMIKVPGKSSSLKLEMALGRDIRIVISPLDALEMAKQNPKKEVVFLGIGFETTAPIIALSIYKAKNENIKNFSILQSIKTMPNVMKEVVKDPQVNIDGFLCPGHVSAIIGVKPFEFLSEELNTPAVIAGFEYCDIIAAIYYLVDMANKEKYEVKNIYNRIVKYEGNEKATAMMNKVFVLSNSEWRGLGNIKDTGFKMKEAYKNYDVKSKIDIKIIPSPIPKDCLCGEILKGIKKPTQCKLFSKVCNPSNPIGACMISQEGTCGAYYKYKIR